MILSQDDSFRCTELVSGLMGTPGTTCKGTMEQIQLDNVLTVMNSADRCHCDIGDSLACVFNDFMSPVCH